MVLNSSSSQINYNSENIGSPTVTEKEAPLAYKTFTLGDGTTLTLTNPVTQEYYDGFNWQPVGTITSVATGTGLTGGPITQTGTVSLANTTVTAGDYIYPTDVVVNAQGQITSITAGSAPPASTTVSGTTNQIDVNHNGSDYAVSLDSALIAPGTVTVSHGNLTVGDSTGDYNFICNSTGYMKAAMGTTAQRPAIPLPGMFRMNVTI